MAGASQSVDETRTVISNSVWNQAHVQSKLDSVSWKLWFRGCGKRAIETGLWEPPRSCKEGGQASLRVNQCNKFCSVDATYPRPIGIDPIGIRSGFNWFWVQCRQVFRDLPCTVVGHYYKIETSLHQRELCTTFSKLSVSLPVYQVRLDWLPLPCIALIRLNQLGCLGSSVGRASAS